MHEEDSGSDSDDLPTVRAKRRAPPPPAEPPLPPPPPPPPVSQDQKVVWPPVVIIENTQTHFDREKRIWKGLENEEIRCFLKGIKDLHFGRVMALYGPKGNKGKSIVIFPPTPLGFMDAQGLCQCLERDHRGRHDWLANRASQRHLITSDGKKVLYGYLASESDMQNVDPYRKIVKRWSMESYVQKVIIPMKQIDVEWQEAKKRRLEMDEEKSRKMLAVEQNKSEFGKAAAEFKKINEEVLHHKRQEEELQAKHRKDECVICMYEFGKELKERALFQSYCHANVCLGCAEKIWKQAALAEKRPECPTCKTEQEEKWTDIPACIYS